MLWQNPHYIPLLVFVFLPTIFLSTYIIAICLKHLKVDFPYISDMGTNIPESCLFGQALNMCAFFVGLTVYIRYKQIEAYIRDQLSTESIQLFSYNRMAFKCGLMSSIGLSFVANFRESEVYAIHLLSAIMAFGLGAVYCWLQTIMSFKLHPLMSSQCMAKFRLILSLLMTVTFVVTLVCGRMAKEYFNGTDPYNWEPSDGGFVLHLTSTVCEWTTAIALDVFILTYVRELETITMIAPKVLVIEEDFGTQNRFNIFETNETMDIIDVN